MFLSYHVTLQEFIMDSYNIFIMIKLWSNRLKLYLFLYQTATEKLMESVNLEGHIWCLLANVSIQPLPVMLFTPSVFHFRA